MSAAAGPREIVLDLPDLTMTALEWGPPDGRLALCAHGFPDSAHGWRLLAPLLAAKGFRVVAPFMRAYAPTGPAPDGDYTIGALMSDLIAAHRALGAPSDAVLIGHDWGGWTTGSMAAYAGSPFAAHIRGRQIGWCAAGDFEELVRLVELMFTDEALWRRCVADARSFAENAFGIERIGSLYRELFHSLTARPPRRKG